MSTTPSCPLCREHQTFWLVQVEQRDYYRCPTCQLRFLDPDAHPGPEAERAVYDLHQNDPADPGYRRFLAQLAEPLLKKLPPDSRGLDFGCGPGPALAAMMIEAGHRVALYDPLYVPDAGVLEGHYDFVTCTEVAEHFHDPAREFERLDALLRPGGWLGIMTRFQTEDDRFADWHYRRDPTHVVFYRTETMEWLGQRYGWEIETWPPGIVVARKRATKN